MNDMIQTINFAKIADRMTALMQQIHLGLGSAHQRESEKDSLVVTRSVLDAREGAFRRVEVASGAEMMTMMTRITTLMKIAAMPERADVLAGKVVQDRESGKKTVVAVTEVHALPETAGATGFRDMVRALQDDICRVSSEGAIHDMREIDSEIAAAAKEIETLIEALPNEAPPTPGQLLASRLTALGLTSRLLPNDDSPEPIEAAHVDVVIYVPSGRETMRHAVGGYAEAMRRRDPIDESRQIFSIMPDPFEAGDKPVRARFPASGDGQADRLVRMPDSGSKPSMAPQQIDEKTRKAMEKLSSRARIMGILDRTGGEAPASQVIARSVLLSARDQENLFANLEHASDTQAMVEDEDAPKFS
jgi:hypothetical protein